MNSRILIIMRHAPYGSTLAREALEVALAFGSFDQKIAILFMGDGIYQLTTDHQPQGIEQKSHSSMLQALPLFDITELYVEETALIRRGLQLIELPQNCKKVPGAQIPQLIHSYDKILSF